MTFELAKINANMRAGVRDVYRTMYSKGAIAAPLMRERLSVLSRVFGCLVSQQGVEDGEEFSLRRRSGRRLAGGDEIGAERFQRRVVTRSHHSGHEQYAADAFAPAADQAFAAPLTGLAGPRSNPKRSKPDQLKPPALASGRLDEQALPIKGRVALTAKKFGTGRWTSGDCVRRPLVQPSATLRCVCSTDRQRWWLAHARVASRSPARSKNRPRAGGRA